MAVELPDTSRVNAVTSDYQQKQLHLLAQRCAEFIRARGRNGLGSYLERKMLGSTVGESSAAGAAFAFTKECEGIPSSPDTAYALSVVIGEFLPRYLGTLGLRSSELSDVNRMIYLLVDQIQGVLEPSDARYRDVKMEFRSAAGIRE